MNNQELREYLKDTNNIYIDKINLIKKHTPKEILQKWAVEVAKSVLHIYEEKYPNDTRVRDCIAATEEYLAGNISISDLESKIKAAYAAAHAAYAAHAANVAAHVAAHAANVAAHAAYAAYTANVAAHAANVAAHAVYTANVAANVANVAAHAAYTANVAANVAAHAAYAAYTAKNRQEQEQLNIELFLKVFVRRIANTKLAREIYGDSIIEITDKELIIN